MTKRILWFQCNAGISGDMALGALLDAGAPQDTLQTWLASLKIPASLTCTETTKNGLAAKQALVTCGQEQAHRHLSQIEAIIDGAALLPEEVKDRSKQVFRRLAAAEAAVHGIDAESVHFHEVGAADAIFDICGTVAALFLLKVDAIFFSPLPVSKGFVDCAHGRLPVPAPAAARLMEGMELFPLDTEGETVTPTGAAILATLGQCRRICPPMRLIKIGCGAGTKDFPHANILRVFLGETSEHTPKEQVTVITTTLDDCNPEILGTLWERIFEAGALDLYYAPVYMKKGRPAIEITLLAPTDAGEKIAALLFSETSTLGLRIRVEERLVLERRHIAVDTPWGKVAVKIAGNTIAPEFESCNRAALSGRVPLKTVYTTALAAAWQKLSVEGEYHD